MSSSNHAQAAREKMFVVNRDGKHVPVRFDRITDRIGALVGGLADAVDPSTITQKVVAAIKSGMSTSEIDHLVAEICAALIATHPDFGTLATRIFVSDMHANTSADYGAVVELLYSAKTPTGAPAPRVSAELHAFVALHRDAINKTLDFSRDYAYDYFGIKTLCHTYLMKVDGAIVERPQHLLMRVAIGVNGPSSLDAVLETYNVLSQRLYTHATPTMFNAGTPQPQLSSCFLTMIKDDSIDGIFSTIKDCAMISKGAGGIGIWAHNIRASGTLINGTGGVSNGLAPMLKVFESTAKYVDQCFPGDTLVWTSDWRSTPIAELKEGDMVVSADGSQQRVTRVLRYGSRSDSGAAAAALLEGSEPETKKSEETEVPLGPLAEARDMVVIAVEGVDGAVHCTAQHPFMVVGRRSCTEPLGEWVDAADITVGDLIAVPPQPAPAVSAECLHRPLDWALVGVLFALINPLEETEAAVRPREQALAMLDEWRAEEDALFTFAFVSRTTVAGAREVFLTQAAMCASLDDIAAIVKGYRDLVGHKQCRALGAHPQIAQLQLRLAAGATGGRGARVAAVSHYVDRAGARPLYDLEVEGSHTYVVPAGIVHNGGGKRKGSIAVYLEPWHADVFEFLEMKRNSGRDDLRARDLFYAMWVPDLFMRRVERDESWSLFCPRVAPGMHLLWGEAFERAYERYERQGLASKTIKARELFVKIIALQQEVGTPYMLYKDAVNRKNNQSNLGTICSSNLCCEVVEFTNENEIAVCNLASVALPRFVRLRRDASKEAKTDEETKSGFDFEALARTVAAATVNLNMVIDRTKYPVAEARHSNLRHRPIGLGVQGLADVFALLDLPYESDAAQTLNAHIFETIYFAALEASHALAQRDGPYESFAGSPASRGQLQFDMWDAEGKFASKIPSRIGSERWGALKEKIVADGLRNSLLVAPMPTATTSQILGNSESFEPFKANLFLRKTLAGEFTCVNTILVAKLVELGLWTPRIKDLIIAADGSVAHIREIPESVRACFKTVWEMKPRVLLDMAAERGRFIDQSQSFNVYLERADQLHYFHLEAWKRGLKTGCYYFRTKPAASAAKTTVSVNLVREAAEAAAEPSAARFSSRAAESGAGETCVPGCDSCGS